MTYANETSASGSATTRPTAPSPKAKSTSEVKKELKDLSEADFLTAQQANAKAAIARTLREMKEDLANAANLRQVHEQHPWMTTAGAAVAGFVAATLLVPSKEETALKKLARWEKALRAAEGRTESQVAAAVSSEGDGKPQVKNEKKGLFASIATELIRTVGPGIASALTAAMAAKGATEQAEAGGNGYAGTDPAAQV